MLALITYSQGAPFYNAITTVESESSALTARILPFNEQELGGDLLVVAVCTREDSLKLSGRQLRLPLRPSLRDETD